MRAAWAGVRVDPDAAADSFTAAVDVAARRARHERLRQQLLVTLYRRDTYAADLIGAEQVERPRSLFGLDTDLVDISLDGNVRLELSTERLQNLRCTPLQLQDPLSGCQPRFRAPRIDNQVMLRSQGIIGKRVNVNIDLDTQRDFTNANTISVFYQGLQDEVVRRIDVGTVQFRPPASRFLTAGIPTNNFGVSTELEIGDLSVQALAATQRGSVVADRTYRIGSETVQPQDRLIRDLDYEPGRFFWTIDPRTIPGFPSVDILTLEGLGIPAGVRPAQVRVYRYRAAAGNIGTNPNLAGISAVATNGEGTSAQTVGPLRWELLVQGQQYWLDPSGLWFVLTTRLDPNDFLAVSYVTADGTTIGTFPAADNPARADSLVLVVEPNRGRDAGTFLRALRNVYRVAGADLNRASLEVAILQNRAERPTSGAATWLSLFGLAIPTDPAVIDTDNRVFPRTRDPGAGEVIRDQFLILPNAQPFGDATRVPDVAQRNDSLYRTPEYLLFSQGPPTKFQLRLQYEARGSGDRSTLSLDARQIRDGTEQLYVDGRRLAKGIDYAIDYGTGLVTFLDPDGLFGTRAATVTARFEQRGVFAVAPTSILGMTASYRIGDLGRINLVGLYQSEATAFNRPALGFEPTASLIGGANADFRFNLPSLTRALGRLTGRPTTTLSSLDIGAEIAFSRPDQNRAGEAFLEEFENDQGIPISLRENAWQFGSMPQSANGLETVGIGAAFDSTDAVQLIWQNLVPNGQGGAVELRPNDIDPNIVIVGGQNVAPETVMYLTFHADTAGGVVGRDNRSRWSQPRQDFRPRWRTMTTPLSLTGVDLSLNEFLEFWVFESFDRPVQSNGLRLVFDLGSVREDALALAPRQFTVSGTDTVYTGRRYAGAGRLDTERSATGTFNAIADDIGILGDRPDTLLGPNGPVTGLPLCRRTLSNVVEVFPWGDLGARCTNGNGALDTEDLNGDLLVDARGPNEDAFRYVIDLGDPRYRVRQGVVSRDPTDTTRTAGWTLYRVPLREPTRLVGQPNIRLVQHLRLAIISPADQGTPDPTVRFAMARMRLVGAPWVRRAETPIAGLSGATGQPRGEVRVSVVTTENTELGYVSPPGVGNAINQIGSGRDGIGVQVNEKALRVVARDLRPGERAEAYTRFVGGTQNLLAYRELRVWMRGRGQGWDDRRLRAFAKVGTDDANFYYYEAEANTATWEPQLRIELERWRLLRAEAEGRFLRGEPPSGADTCGGDPEAYIVCDDEGYVVHLRNPGITPPNLAAVQELAAGIRYPDGTQAPISETELWINDIRLGAPLTEFGIAAAMTARLQAADLGTVDLNYLYQDGQFRQIGQNPSYRSTGTFTGATSLDVGRLLPEQMGLVVPIALTHQRASVNPELLTGSDIRGTALDGLRRPEATSTTWSFGLARARRDGSFLMRALVNPLQFRAGGATSATTTELTVADGRSWSAGVTWQVNGARRGRPIGLEGLVRGLPEWLRESEAGRGLGGGTFALAPTQVRLNSALSRQAADFTTFAVPIRRAADTVLQPVTSLQHLWRNDAATTWQPLGMLTVNATWASTRDLRVYPDSTPLGRLAGQERRSFLGVDAGVERDRDVGTTVALQPRVNRWLRPRYVTTTSFVLSRSLTTRNPIRVDGDTAGEFILPQTLNNSRRNELGATIEPAQLVSAIFGDSAGTSRYFSRMRPLDATWSTTRQSSFDLATFDPGASYQLALGGLDRFLRQGNELAIGAGETRTAALTGGLDLPLGLTATARYASTLIDRYQRVGREGFLKTESDQRDWPDASLNWSRSFRRGPVLLVNVGSRVRERESINRIPVSETDVTFTRTFTRSIEPDFRIALRNGLSISGNASFDDGRNETNGNVTVSDNASYNAVINWSMRLPASISRLRRALRTTVSLNQFAQTQCLIRVGSPDCVTISDFRRTDLRSRFDADLTSVVTGSFQLGWSVNELRHLERKTSTITAAIQLSIPLTLGAN